MPPVMNPPLTRTSSGEGSSLRVSRPVHRTASAASVQLHVGHHIIAAAGSHVTGLGVSAPTSTLAREVTNAPLSASRGSAVLSGSGLAPPPPLSLPSTETPSGAPVDGSLGVTAGASPANPASVSANGGNANNSNTTAANANYPALASLMPTFRPKSSPNASSSLIPTRLSAPTAASSSGGAGLSSSSYGPVKPTYGAAAPPTTASSPPATAPDAQGAVGKLAPLSGTGRSAAAAPLTTGSSAVASATTATPPATPTEGQPNIPVTLVDPGMVPQPPGARQVTRRSVGALDLPKLGTVGSALLVHGGQLSQRDAGLAPSSSLVLLSPTASVSSAATTAPHSSSLLSTTQGLVSPKVSSHHGQQHLVATITIPAGKVDRLNLDQRFLKDLPCLQLPASDPGTNTTTTTGSTTPITTGRSASSSHSTITGGGALAAGGGLSNPQAVAAAVSQVKLLNLQNNDIETLVTPPLQTSPPYTIAPTPLSCFQQVVYLDLYNNKLSSMCGAESLKKLRVLMVGKNRLTDLSTLHDHITSQALEVLDVHGNCLTTFFLPPSPRIVGSGGCSSSTPPPSSTAGLGARVFPQLRVLNVAGNRLLDLCGMECLPSLSEFNARRNRIHGLPETMATHTVNLRKCFLSSNQLGAGGPAECHSVLNILSRCKNLEEVTVDGCPLSNVNAEQQRPFLVSSLPGLRLLDSVAVTAEEREQAAANALPLRAGGSFASASCDEIVGLTKDGVGGSVDSGVAETVPPSDDSTPVQESGTPTSAGNGGGGGEDQPQSMTSPVPPLSPVMGGGGGSGGGTTPSYSMPSALKNSLQRGASSSLINSQPSQRGSLRGKSTAASAAADGSAGTLGSLSFCGTTGTWCVDAHSALAGSASRAAAAGRLQLPVCPHAATCGAVCLDNVTADVLRHPDLEAALFVFALGFATTTAALGNTATGSATTTATSIGSASPSCASSPVGALLSSPTPSSSTTAALLALDVQLSLDSGITVWDWYLFNRILQRLPRAFSPPRWSCLRGPVRSNGVPQEWLALLQLPNSSPLESPSLAWQVWRGVSQPASRWAAWRSTRTKTILHTSMHFAKETVCVSVRHGELLRALDGALVDSAISLKIAQLGTPCALNREGHSAGENDSNTVTSKVAALVASTTSLSRRKVLAQEQGPLHEQRRHQNPVDTPMTDVVYEGGRGAVGSGSGGNNGMGAISVAGQRLVSGPGSRRVHRAVQSARKPLYASGAHRRATAVAASQSSTTANLAQQTNASQSTALRVAEDHGGDEEEEEEEEEE